MPKYRIAHYHQDDEPESPLEYTDIVAHDEADARARFRRLFSWTQIIAFVEETKAQHGECTMESYVVVAVAKGNAHLTDQVSFFRFYNEESAKIAAAMIRKHACLAQAEVVKDIHE